MPVEVRRWLSLEASSQATCSVHGLSEPGSVKEPRSKVCDEPSLAVWLPGAVSTGATLATSTTWTACESASAAPSESVTLMTTLVDFGPSGKAQSNEPPVAVTVAGLSSVPNEPQVG